MTADATALDKVLTIRARTPLLDRLEAVRLRLQAQPQYAEVRLTRGVAARLALLAGLEALERGLP